ncbi:MAG: energy transducer TonB [Flavobacteriales bacterium]|nr:energy transducer TonB [Crocinitomicaceae bacterium]NBX79230.1 energy transducer TonB [Flavobacteriales bacterium]NCA21314.1 energy transducer TonB [Crocinitomicaceae bacterium]
MKVIIKEPCLENWDNMKVGIDSRHCDLCNKSVIDFTQKNRAEIITYLLDRSNERVCGRMKGNEFEMKEADIPVLMEVLRAPKYRSNAFLILAIVCSSVFSSCESTNNQDAIKVYTKVGVEKFVKMNDSTVIGKIIPNESKVNDENSSSFVSDETSDKYKDTRILPRIVPPEPLPERVKIWEGDDYSTVLGKPSIYQTASISNEKEPETILNFAEVMPEFPGGMESLLVYLKKNIIYPTVYKEQGIEGKVYVQFIVTVDGEITNPVVLRGVLNAELFSREAIRVVRSMPKWNPGKNDGKNVSVRTTIPIKFELSD